MSKTQQQRPSTTGLYWYRHQYFSFFVPLEWQKLSWSDDREGVIYSPDPNDPHTLYAAELKDLEMEITDDDFEVIAEGFFEGIAKLPGSAIESQNQEHTGNIRILEAKYTFLEQNKNRKRWVRVYYYKTRQLALTSQGSTPEKYDYWIPWFYEAMMTAKVHDNLPENPY